MPQAIPITTQAVQPPPPETLAGQAYQYVMGLDRLEELYAVIDSVRPMSFPTAKYLLVSWCKQHRVRLTRGLVDQLRPPIRYLPTPY